MKNKKKIAAASAVLAYIKEEEEIAGAMAMQAQAGMQESHALAQQQMILLPLNGLRIPILLPCGSMGMRWVQLNC